MIVLQLEDFAPHVGQNFPVDLGETAGEPPVLALEEATPLKFGRPDARPPFSLIWRGPRELPLPQGLYNLGHPQRGKLEIFIAPLGLDERGFVYQSIFN